MMRFIIHILTACLLSALLFGCGEDAPQPVRKAPQKKKVQSPIPKKAAAQEETLTQEAIENIYTYDPTNRRDPFVALLEMRRPVVDSNEPLTPLQRIDLEQLRLRGVIIGKGSPMAMVAAPGGKSFILKNGVKVGRNNGVVVGIDAEGVSVREKYYDFVGEVRENVQKIELPKREGAN